MTETANCQLKSSSLLPPDTPSLSTSSTEKLPERHSLRDKFHYTYFLDTSRRHLWQILLKFV